MENGKPFPKQESCRAMNGTAGYVSHQLSNSSKDSNCTSSDDARSTNTATSVSHIGHGHGCAETPRSTASARHQESVGQAFLRQVRDSLVVETAIPKPIEPTTSGVSILSRHSQHATTRLPETPNINLRLRMDEELPLFRPEMSSDAQIPTTGNGKILGKPKAIKPENRRDTLLDQLSSCTYECLICCGKIYYRQSIWNCQSCYNAFHLHCIKKWSESSAIQGEWRCPGCQNIVGYYPRFYFCYCGNIKNPPYSCSDVPHSCGNSCGKKKSTRDDCSHLCTLPCHPGPCEDCTAMVNRKCCCGKTKAFVQCRSKASVLCRNPCDRLLKCDTHRCQASCHAGDCADCDKAVILDCHCGRNTKLQPCSPEANANYRPKYSCDLICNRLLNCKNHRCANVCHPGHCDPCQTSTDVVVSCPCGQTSIAEACRKIGLPLRSSCQDKIPSCGKVCSKILSCGPFDTERHRCFEKCHSDDSHCFCPLVTTAPCRCGNQQIDIPCVEYEPGKELKCERRCSKKRNCGRHKCTTKCCIDPDHICMIVCNKLLSCGNHRCEALCHNGHCKLCPNISFDELRCECGESILYPPVPCGTPPPSCDQPCLRNHQCDHPVHHQCHSEPNCPPCPFLTEKWCHGKHQLRKHIPCYNNNVSCGLPCGKTLRCGRHRCPKTCHSGDCDAEGAVCNLKCGLTIKCGHPCSSPCHAGDCPHVLCRQLTPVTCPCGRTQEVMLCYKREAEYQRLLAEAIAQGLEEGQKTEELVAEFTTKFMASKDIACILPCDKECARVERMRKIAEALQLHNPDPETRIGPPAYSDFLKTFAQKNPQFVEGVHLKLSTLVMQTKKSKKLNNTFGFEVMNREKRSVVHEYAGHFGCQSESFDEEPNRNVVVTASKDKCWLPSMSLVDVVFRKATATTGRKNVYQDLELVEPPKSKIIGPTNLNFK